MGKAFTREEATKLKETGINRLNSLLESYINKPSSSSDGDPEYLKKTALLSKWLYQYANYISFEDRFDPAKNISYKRGDIIFVNFGFGVGSEFGGNHYATVLDKENKHNSPTITVIPLSSYKKEKSVYERDVYLGNELFDKLQLKLKTNLSDLSKQREEAKQLQNTLRAAFPNLSNEQDIVNYRKLQTELASKITVMEKETDNAKRVLNELLTMKFGSVAKIEQIRTISKMRIYNPRNKSDPLYGIRFSENTMQSINDQIKKFFVF